MTRVSCSMLASVEFYWFSKKKEKKRKSNILRIYQVCRAVNRFAPPSMLIALQCQRSSLETHKLAVLGIRDTQTIRESQHSRGFRCLCPDPLDVTVCGSTSELDRYTQKRRDITTYKREHHERTEVAIDMCVYKLRERYETNSPLETSASAWPLQHLDFGLLASRIVRE